MNGKSKNAKFFKKISFQIGDLAKVAI
jgi:hypothetical protein